MNLPLSHDRYRTCKANTSSCLGFKDSSYSSLSAGNKHGLGDQKSSTSLGGLNCNALKEKAVKLTYWLLRLIKQQNHWEWVINITFIGQTTEGYFWLFRVWCDIINHWFIHPDTIWMHWHYIKGMFVFGNLQIFYKDICVSVNYYTDQNYKRSTFVFAPIFHELNSKI